MNRGARLCIAAMFIATFPACGNDIEWFPERQVTTAPTSGNNSSTSSNNQMGGAIQRQLSLSQSVSTFAGSSQGATDGTGTSARFNGPSGVTTDGTSLFVIDSGNFTIRRISLTTGDVSTLAGTAGSSGTTDGVGDAARFTSPTSITTDGTNLYLADGSAIRKVVISTGAVTTIAGAVGTSGSLNATGTAARFATPYLTTDGTTIYIADSGNEIVRSLVISTGVVTTIAGSSGASGGVDGAGTAARFGATMNGITTDGTNLFVVDTSNNTIRKIVIATRVVTTLAGTAGSPGWADATGFAARFSGPTGITADGTNLYVSDSTNSTIRKIVISTGVVSTLAGTHGVDGSVDATGAMASFKDPQGLTTDGKSLFVVDRGNNRIRKIM